MVYIGFRSSGVPVHENKIPISTFICICFKCRGSVNSTNLMRVAFGLKSGPADVRSNVASPVKAIPRETWTNLETGGCLIELIIASFFTPVSLTIQARPDYPTKIVSSSGRVGYIHAIICFFF